MGLEPLEKLATDIAPAGNENENSDNPPAPLTPDALSDEKVLEFLKSKGITATSLEELKPKTKEEAKTPEQIAEEREAAKLTYGIQKGLFKKQDYDNFVTDSQNKDGLVFSQYAADAKEDDPALTDEEIQAEFDEKFGLTAEPGTRKHKRGQQEIAVLHDRIMQNKYNKIYGADNAYSAYESKVNNETAWNERVKKETPAYAKVVEEAFSELKKIPAKFSDTESYEADIMADSINKVKEYFLKPEIIEKYISEGYTKDEIKDMATTSVLRLDFPNIAKAIAVDYARKNQKGAKGIIEGGKATTLATGEKVLTDDQKQMLEVYQKANEKAAEVN